MGAKTRGNYPHYPKPGMTCPACCFGESEHAEWCERLDLVKPMTYAELASSFTALFRPCDELERAEEDFTIQAWPPTPHIETQ
jgi:hypothetical protein